MITAHLEQGIQRALAAIERVRVHYRRPAFMCSFGKDSMVLLDLLERHANWRLPVIFLRDPWWPRKYEFADSQIRERELEVHDWPPAAVTLWEGVSVMAFTNHYQIGPLPGGVLDLPKNIIPPEPGKRFLCGLEVLDRPKGGYAFPWDVVLHGHKSSDTDQIAGDVPLCCDIKKNAGTAPDAAFPLRTWTDADVWAYTQHFGVPQQADRYDIAGQCERPDKTTNSDYGHVCIACIDRREKAPSVYCPKLNCEVSVCADRVPYRDVRAAYFTPQKEPC